MIKKHVAPYEVLAQPVAPAKVSIPNLPYVIQGFFLQVSNIDVHAVKIDIEYVGTPQFIASSGAVKLFADIIDPTGTASLYAIPTFLTPKIGFKNQTIPKQATVLFGVQYILDPPPAPTVTAATGATPQDSASSRGFISIEAPAKTRLLVGATTRQVFNNYSPGGTLLDISEGAYAVPIVGGPELTF